MSAKAQVLEFAPWRQDMSGSRETLFARRTAREIEQWLVDHLAMTLERPAEQIDPTVPFDSFALDSVSRVAEWQTMKGSIRRR